MALVDQGLLQDTMRVAFARTCRLCGAYGGNKLLDMAAPSKCTKRDQELRLGPKEKSKVLTVLDNSVTVTTQPEKIVSDHGTPLQLQWCLQRRRLAFDMNRTHHLLEDP